MERRARRNWLCPDHRRDNLPAGLSPTVIGQELRIRNGYTGVIITDTSEAGALNAFGSTGQRAVSAAGAGMDLILCSAATPTTP